MKLKALFFVVLFSAPLAHAKSVMTFIDLALNPPRVSKISLREGSVIWETQVGTDAETDEFMLAGAIAMNGYFDELRLQELNLAAGESLTGGSVILMVKNQEDSNLETELVAEDPAENVPTVLEAQIVIATGVSGKKYLFSLAPHAVSFTFTLLGLEVKSCNAILMEDDPKQTLH